MEYRRLGKSGLKISELSFGAWVTFGNQVDEKLAGRLMGTAYDAGVNFFDNAEVYEDGRAEVLMGKVLKKTCWPRDSFVVSSKVFFGHGPEGPNQTGLSRKHVFEACHAALKRLQVDYLDLYFCHRPDPETPIEETVRAMNDLIRQGKVLYWGTSEWSAREIREAANVSRDNHLIGPTMEQSQYNMFHRDRVENEYSFLYGEIGLGTTIWSPLASGLLTGKYNAGDPGDTRISVKGYEWLRSRFEGKEFEEKIKAVRELGSVAGEIGITLPRMALAWCLKNPNVSTVITGASRLEQLTENLQAAGDGPKLTPEIMEKIEGILKIKPVG